jgi:uncharacterized membrane protein
MKNSIQWPLIGFIVFVFIQSLFFKFSGSEETVIIFTTIVTWMQSIGISNHYANGFAAHGGLLIGTVELIASVLIILPLTRLLGALLSLAVISGAIFFHLFTPLGVNRIIDAAGNTDGGALFFMACGVWLCAAATAFNNRPIKKNPIH